MTAVFELLLFMAGISFVSALIFRICKEGDYDDFD